MSQPRFIQLQIQASGEGYRVAAHAPDGARTDFQSFELPSAILNTPREPTNINRWVREFPGGTPAFGEMLFRALFDRDVARVYHSAQAWLGQQLPVRLILPPPLSSIPWELLRDPQQQSYLAPVGGIARAPLLPAPLRLG